MIYLIDIGNIRSQKVLQNKNKNPHLNDAFTFSNIPNHERGRVRVIMPAQPLGITYERDSYIVVSRQLLKRATKRICPEDLILVSGHHSDLGRCLRSG